MSIGVIIVMPLILLAFITGLVTNAETLRPSQWLLFPSVALLLFVGWGALAAGMLRAEAQQRLGKVNVLVAAVALFGIGVGGIWFALEGFTSHRTPGEQPIVTLIIGLFMLVVCGLVVFRKRLPWNRPRTSDLNTAPKLHRMRLRDHLGEVRAVRLDSKIPAEAVMNAQGVAVASRFAWVLVDAGLSESVEVVEPGTTISSWHLLVTEATEQGTITYQVPRAAPRIQQLWHAALQERV